MPIALLETCPDCNCKLAPVTSSKHPYLGGSASCWSLFNLILAREYSSPALMKSVHRLTVDAYAAQHPGRPERRTIQSVWVHLAGLHLTLERGLAPEFALQVIGLLTKRTDALVWLEPSPFLGPVTVQNMIHIPAAEHEEAVRRWARSVWDAWAAHHTAIHTICSEVLASGKRR
jgi:hypothetical protein